MTDDLTALRELAEKATPGPWTVRGHEVISEANLGTVQAPWIADVDGPFADAQFIAAANPTTILALLDRLERAEAAIERVRALHWEVFDTDHGKLCNECSDWGTDTYPAGQMISWPCPTLLAALDTWKEPGHADSQDG